jgi:hypothetical protein
LQRAGEWWRRVIWKHKQAKPMAMGGVCGGDRRCRDGESPMPARAQRARLEFLLLVPGTSSMSSPGRRDVMVTGGGSMSIDHLSFFPHLFVFSFNTNDDDEYDGLRLGSV